MQIKHSLEQIQQSFESGLKKRYACSHCGKTWVEIVGLFAGNVDGQDDVYFQIGTESEVCQSCRFRMRTCPSCGSKDAYEINFSLGADQSSPLSFDRIRMVSRT